MHRSLRLICNKDALRANYRHLASMSRGSCGAAVKANAYGLGGVEAASILVSEGCRDFFVSTWDEAAKLGDLAGEASIVVLHGVGPDDRDVSTSMAVRPALSTVEQVARWKERAPGKPCDVMIDTGMNRLGLRIEDIGVLEGLSISTVHSHLACADEDHPMNLRQLERFRQAAAAIPASRYALANSAGIFLGRDYHFDLVRPGLALYGGIPRAEARGRIHSVAAIEAQVLQRRTVRAGESVGYGATFVAEADVEVAILNIGYADGYWRGFAQHGFGRFAGKRLPVVGRVSMDLLALECSAVPQVREGDWVEVAFDLEVAAETTGMTQYELLTGLGDRFDRIWR